jgi:predicted nuclease of predicted toxin-antitoxin system
MRFLCDVHIRYKLVAFLQKKNCNAYHVNDILSDKAQDFEIATYADENDCIVITKDEDFKNSFLLSGTPKKLIKLNTDNSSTKQILYIFERNWDIILRASEKSSFYLESDVINFYWLEL